jgi:hypothetical protein
LGYGNTANGVSALKSNTYGNYNTANGVSALQNNTTGSQNIATGFNALLSNTTGNNNTAIGITALRLNSTGSQNTATGVNALFTNTTGIQNTATGHGALQSNTGNNNTAIGFQALLNNTSGNNNTAIGASTNATTAVQNSTAIGVGAIIDNSNQIVLGRSSERVKIPGSYVGIGGVYNPTSGFNVDVSGNLQIQYASGGSGGPPLLKLVNNTVQYQGGQSNIEFWNNNSNYRLGKISAIDTAPNNTYRSALALSASYHTDGFVEGMRIVAQSASLAFVGIGTTTPSAPLTVFANSNTDPETNGIYIFNPTNTANQNAICTMRVAGTSGGDAFSSYDILNETGWSAGLLNSDNSYRISNSWSNLSTNTRLTILTGGNVGIGTTTPSKQFSLGSNSSTQKLSLYDDGTGNNFFGFGAISDAIHFGAGTNNNANGQMVLTSTGRLGIGTTTPNSTLDVSGNTSNPDSNSLFKIVNTNSTSNNTELRITPGLKQATATANFVTYDIPGNGTHFFWDSVEISSSCRAQSFITSSDYRIKKNVKNLDDTYNIDFLRPVTYLNTESEKQDIGLIAHELQEIYPQLVTGEKDGEEFQSVNYTGLIPILIKEIQDLKKNNVELTNQILDLKKIVEKLL